jgi:Glycerophosphoryl diester phosphodiesterase family
MFVGSGGFPSPLRAYRLLMKNPLRNTIIVLCCIMPFLSICAQQHRQQRPLPHAHAHNDYEHDRPLFDAIDCGFMSVEADVFLVNGELLVAHNLKDTKPERTLEKLYLKPLYERFKRSNQESIYPEGGEFTLLVDIKNNGAATYELLNKQLQPFAEMLSTTDGDKHTKKAVTIIISGDRPVDAIKATNPRYVGIDGRLTDLESDEPSSLYPLISDNWRLHFKYRGDEAITKEDQDKLHRIISKAHEKERRVRFWATPESEMLWGELIKAKVDLIGTDDLHRLRDFLHKP